MVRVAHLYAASSVKRRCRSCSSCCCDTRCAKHYRSVSHNSAPSAPDRTYRSVSRTPPMLSRRIFRAGYCRRHPYLYRCVRAGTDRRTSASRYRTAGADTSVTAYPVIEGGRSAADSSPTSLHSILSPEACP